MTVVGLELSATHVRALGGPDGMAPRPLALDGTRNHFPTAVCLQGRVPEVGRAGTAILREWPHLVCHDFLAHLGTTRGWAAGRHRLDAAKAVTLVLERLKPGLSAARAAAMVLPGYLSAEQASQVNTLAQKIRLPILGSITAPLATALAAHGDKRWSGSSLFIDADDHALTWAIVQIAAEHIRVVESKTFPRLGTHPWKMCLLNKIAERCIRHSRRDPRDSGAAEQLLYDQLDAVMDAASQGQMVEIVVRTDTWCQNLFLQPDQVFEFSAARVEEAADDMGVAFAEAAPEGFSGVWVTHAAGRLPGLLSALREIAGERVAIQCLPEDALLRAAHELAGRLLRGELPHAHMDVAAPLTKPAPAKGANFLKLPNFIAER